MNSKVETLATNIESIKSENENLKEKVENLMEENKLINQQLNNLEQYTRKGNIIISSIPCFDQEDAIQIVYRIAERVKVELFEYNICNAHRLPMDNDRIPLIIVKLNSTLRKRK